MDFINVLPIWAVALTIFGLRIVDVSLGTIRTIAVVGGRTWLSMGLGFLEILVWLIAISQVITRLNENLLLMLAYAGGYAAGNAVGITLERMLALGNCVVRIISIDQGEAIARTLRAMGQGVTTFEGQGRDGPRLLIYAICDRKDLSELVHAAKSVDPHLFYAVERLSKVSRIMPLTHQSNWQGTMHKK